LKGGIKASHWAKGGSMSFFKREKTDTPEGFGGEWDIGIFGTVLII